ncbi:MAG: DUF1501 domain-containing protein, partial [Proteobacteria bacterium]|nr:DUF1501 domain-containing protein [Pseudomonadota bacterium]
MKRRDFIKDSGLFLLTSASIPSIFGIANAASAERKREKVLVVIFQRGAADGLAMVVPHGDSDYTKEIRPSIFLGRKDTLKLDEFFGLHPSLKDLIPLWDAKKFAVIHQVGSTHETRSHFDAQDYMESGMPGIKSIEDGFLDRLLLRMHDEKEKSIFKGLAMQPNLPRSLWGTSGAFAMNSIQEFAKADVGKVSASAMAKGFESMYDSALDQALRGAGQNSFEAIKMLKKLPGGSGSYPKTKLGKRMSDIARLIKGNVGLRVAMTDCGGWDTHQRQGSTSGPLANNLADLGGSIAAFMDDLGQLSKDVCVVTMTEFGRTVKENGNGGTDHGHGSVMFLVGDKVIGRQVRSRWTALNPELLYEGRDLPVTTDFRDVWCEVFASHL